MTAATTISVSELAAIYGVDCRTVRKWIRQGLAARKAGDPLRWEIDEATAGPWVAANASRTVGPRLAGLGALEPTTGNGTQAVAGEAPSAGVRTPVTAEVETDRDDELAGAAAHIDRLDLILKAFTDLIFNAKEFDPRLVNSVKAISTELRRLEVHRLEMRKAEAALIDRADHVRVLGTFARLVVDEINAWARTTPDAVVDALTAAGVKIKAKRVVTSLDNVLEIQTAELRTRIAEAVEQAEDIE